MKGARIGHSPGVEFCEREVQENRKQFEARLDPIFETTLVSILPDAGIARDRIDQNSVFSFVERSRGGPSTRESVHSLAESIHRTGRAAAQFPAVFGIVHFFEIRTRRCDRDAPLSKAFRA